MSFLAGLGITSEKPPIVIEIGVRFTKVGFSGETGPRIIVHTPTHFEQATVDEIGEFMLWIYNIHLQISPRERRLLFVEKLLEKSAVREDLTRVALNRLAVPGVVFLSRPVAAVTCAGIASNTALTVNIGWEGLSVTPVVHGVPMIWNQTNSPIGGKYFAEQLKSRTLKINPDFDADMGIEMFDDIVARLGYIRDIADITNPSPTLMKQDETLTNIDIDGRRVLRVKRGDISEVVEHVFTRFNEDSSLPTMVLESLLETPIDSRRALAGNLILSGGGARMPGLERRLLQEIETQVKTPRYSKLQNLDFILTDMPCHSNCVSWLGGAIYAAGESVWRNQIDLAGLKVGNGEEEFGNIPDWCGNPLPEPKLPSSRPSLATQSPIRRMLQISKINK